MATKMVESVIHQFYALALDDVIIGYQFRKIPDFMHHLPRIQRFWALQLGIAPVDMGRETYNLIQVHLPLNIHQGEVGRWATLFKQTVQASELPEEMKAKWAQKIDFFHAKFLESALLFPRR